MGLDSQVLKKYKFKFKNEKDEPLCNILYLVYLNLNLRKKVIHDKGINYKFNLFVKSGNLLGHFVFVPKKLTLK